MRGHRVLVNVTVQLWVDNNGKLPDGLVLAEGDIGVQAAADAVETPPVIPNHKVLTSTYELKSKVRAKLHPWAERSHHNS